MYTRPDVGIYKRKPGSKKERIHAFDQEKKKNLLSFFSYFLVFFYKFSTQENLRGGGMRGGYTTQDAGLELG